MTTALGIDEWLALYERASWAPGTDLLSQLFTDRVSYVPSLWPSPYVTWKT